MPQPSRIRLDRLPGLRLHALLRLALAMACLAPAVAEVDRTALDAIATGAHRSEGNQARNVYRNPIETLAFFEVAPDMTVVEVWPGRGWYTEVLAPYLRDTGTLYAAAFTLSASDTLDYRRRIQAAYEAQLKAQPDQYDQVSITELGAPNAWTAAPAGTADRVLTFRNVHNWMKGGFDQAMFRAFYAALKPGGVLGVVEHRARPGTAKAEMIESGYVTEMYVIELAARAGFELVGSSEVNANKADDRDHPEGVWTLPPALRLGDDQRERYLAIGESDRMTLKFKKPETAASSSR